MEDKELRELKEERLKTVYEQAAVQHRYFLNWRYLITAGYIAITGAIIVFGGNCYKETYHLNRFFFVIPFTLIVITLIFWRVP